MPDKEYVDVGAAWKKADRPGELGFPVKKEDLIDLLQRGDFSTYKDKEVLWFNVKKNDKGDNPKRPDFRMSCRVHAKADTKPQAQQQDDEEDLPF